MKYSDARPKIKSGDVLAWTDTSWEHLEAQMVRIFTRSEYTHVGIAWVIAGRVFILEAVSPKIRIFPLSKEVPFYWIPVDEYWHADLEEYALSLVGNKYSRMEALRAFFKKVVVGKNDEWQCAEYVSSILQKGGVVESEPIPANIVMALIKKGCQLNWVEKD
jgi:hypothetical protein